MSLSLPVFPDFVQLELGHRSAIEAITSKFEPYSDFNFTNLWAWDIDGSTRVSILNDNLVFRLTDFDNDYKQFFTFIGENNIDATITDLINEAKKTSIVPSLHLLPEIVVKNIGDRSKFIVEEDRDNFDYIVSSEQLSSMVGRQFSPKRTHVNKFLSLYGEKVEFRELKIDSKLGVDIIGLHDNWRKTSAQSAEQTEHEFIMTNRLVENASAFNLITFAVYIEGTLAAYSIYEKVGDYAVGHSEKALRHYSGIYEYLKKQSATRLNNAGVKYINLEQDLGIAGLREAKMRLHPVKFLKKYSVSYKE